jgi:hypothetical protein
MQYDSGSYGDMSNGDEDSPRVRRNGGSNSPRKNGNNQNNSRRKNGGINGEIDDEDDGGEYGGRYGKGGKRGTLGNGDFNSLENSLNKKRRRKVIGPDGQEYSETDSDFERDNRNRWNKGKNDKEKNYFQYGSEEYNNDEMNKRNLLNADNGNGD